MAKQDKRFSNEKEYLVALNKIEWKAIVYPAFLNDVVEDIAKATDLHETEELKDARFLLKLLEEKLEAHNARCKQKAGQMKQVSYKRNHIQDYNF